MPMPTLRPQHWLLFVLVAAAFFSLALWMQRGGESGEPLAWVSAWQQPLLEPMAEGELTLGALNRESPGELWLQPGSDGPRLLFRSTGDGADACNLEAELALDAGERESLLKALGTGAGQGDQPLSPQMLEQLAGHHLAALELRPQQPPAASRLAASVGQPRLRLQLGEGEAWVYPAEGLTAHVLDEQVHQVRVVPRSTLRH
ncbi:hypothetical protein [Pseudomonas tohonis]|uniref:hypothetical protein n=1 Tax=Pseudomonas tohonis TaxID=2725477 RepID=UPI001F28B1D5|nr:hypothetical protein [Pseudomonas tohonis]